MPHILQIRKNRSRFSCEHEHTAQHHDMPTATLWIGCNDGRKGGRTEKKGGVTECRKDGRKRQGRAEDGVYTINKGEKGVHNECGEGGGRRFTE